MRHRGLLLLLLSAGAQGQTLVAERGKAHTVVVVSPSAAPAERYAAEEVAHWLGEITGATIPLQIADVAPENAIVVGQGPLARSLAPDLHWDRLGVDEAIARTVGQRTLLVGGRPRGSMNAVFRQLARLGCRWWTPWARTIPTRKSLTLPKQNRDEQPAFESRDPFWFSGYDADWAARNATNGQNTRLDERHGGKVEYAGGFVHTFYPLVPPDPYFRLHPEWFSLIGGKRTTQNAQLCTTDPALRDFVVERVRERLRANPSASIVSVSQNDCFGPCQCERCQALAQAEGSEAAPVLALANYVAERIEREFPTVAVDTLAYQYTRKAPKTLRPRPNVIVRLCSIECNFAQPLTHPSNASFANDVRDWSRLTDRLYIWNYGTNFANYPQPFPDYFVIGPNERFFRANGVRGIFEEGNGQSNGSDFAEMRSWVEGQLLWDPSRDDKALIDEFLRGYYGPAARPIRKTLDLFANVPDARIYDPPMRPYLSFEPMRKAEAFWQEAERRVKDRPDLLWRVRQGHLAVRWVWLNRWNGFRAEAREKGVAWPLPASRKTVADEWLALATGPGPAGWSPMTLVRESGQTPQAWIAQFAVDPPEPARLPTRGKNPPLPAGLEGKKVVDLQDGLARLANQPDWAELRDDAAASDGIACWMPGAHHEWAFQLPLAKVEKGRYRVLVVARVERSTDEGVAFSAGVYDDVARESLASSVFQARDVGTGYRTFDLGLVSLSPTAYVWVAPPGRSEVREVWIDRVLLVRE